MYSWTTVYNRSIVRQGVQHIPDFQSSVPGRDSNDSSHCVAPTRSSLSALNVLLLPFITFADMVLRNQNQKSLPLLHNARDDRLFTFAVPLLLTSPCSIPLSLAHHVLYDIQFIERLKIPSYCVLISLTKRRQTTEQLRSGLQKKINPNGPFTGANRNDILQLSASALGFFLHSCVPSFRFQVSFRCPLSALHQPAAL
ncbi:hypothetical protein HNR77_004806 [Paenibacillus sp. JGP012]|nr:hypothetical protein [Paenibacillus sp. JGP012]